MGGEKSITGERSLYTLGSPPHGRGKALLLLDSLVLLRITPAWAGKSCIPFVLIPFEWDHPRMGGEKLSVLSCYKIA